MKNILDRALASAIREAAQERLNREGVERQLAAAQERENSLDGDNGMLLLWVDRLVLELAQARERSQRAEALAESYRKDAERYRWLKTEGGFEGEEYMDRRIAEDAARKP